MVPAPRQGVKGTPCCPPGRGVAATPPCPFMVAVAPTSPSTRCASSSSSLPRAKYRRSSSLRCHAKPELTDALVYACFAAVVAAAAAAASPAPKTSGNNVGPPFARPTTFSLQGFCPKLPAMIARSTSPIAARSVGSLVLEEADRPCRTSISCSPVFGSQMAPAATLTMFFNSVRKMEVGALTNRNASTDTRTWYRENRSGNLGRVECLAAKKSNHPNRATSAPAAVDESKWQSAKSLYFCAATRVNANEVRSSGTESDASRFSRPTAWSAWSSFVTRLFPFLDGLRVLPCDTCFLSFKRFVSGSAAALMNLRSDRKNSTQST
mmetsp:Transcript_533/g.2074  ORF Transcript_533/g.2074 Transcript_533/m.2074 type:complete len:323 (+) Transcript_533:2419-3387(+)